MIFECIGLVGLVGLVKMHIDAVGMAVANVFESREIEFGGVG